MKVKVQRQWKKITAVLVALLMVVGLLPDGAIKTFAATVEHPGVFTISVKDAEGVAISNSSVKVIYGEEKTELINGVTGEDGVFEVPEFSDGTAQAVHGTSYTIVINKPGYLEKSQPFKVEDIDTSNLDITIFKTVQITGTVVGENEAAVANATVSFEGDDFSTITTDTKSDGTFALTGADCKNAKLTVGATENKYKDILVTTINNSSDVNLGNLRFEVKTFDVSFSNDENGMFKAVDGKPFVDNKVTVPYGSTVSFKFVATTGYKVTLKDGIEELLADDKGVYSINNVTANHTVESATTDTTPPEISNVNVSDSDIWKTSKNITFNVSDNSKGNNVIYISTSKYTDKVSLNAANDKYEVTSPDTDNGEDTLSYTVSANGKYYIYALDAYNNMSSTFISVDKIDTVEPTISEITVPEQWSNINQGINVSFKVSDDNEVKHVYYATTSDYLIAEKTELIAEKGEYKFTATKNITYHLFAVDGAGNVGKGDAKVEKIDTDVPVVTSILKSPIKDWASSEVTIIVSALDQQETGITDGSGVSKIVYSTSPTGYVDNNYSSVTENSNGNYTFNVPEMGFNGIYYVWAIDKQNQVSASKEIPVKIDTKAPVISSMSYVEDSERGFFKRVIKALSFGLLFKDEVHISVNATDNRPDKDSGIAKYQYQLVEKDNSLLPDGWVDYPDKNESIEIKLNIDKNEDFQGKVYVRVYDTAGNISEAITDTADGTTIVKDNNAPKDTPIVNLNGYIPGRWTNQDAIITLSGTSSVSGVDRYQYRIDYNNEEKADVNWTDMPASTETMKQADDSQAYIKDKITISWDENATYYFRSVSNVNLPSEETEGYVIRVQKTTPENAKVNITKADGINNWHISYPEITITEPTISNFVAPVTTYYKLWNTTLNETEDTAVEVKFTGSNPPVISEDGEYILKVWTKDEAGNVCESSKMILEEINVDTTKPTTSGITVPVGWSTINQGIVVSFNASDNYEVKHVYYATTKDYAKAEKTELMVEDGKYKFTATENVTYYFFAVDDAGNVGEGNTTIEYIDTTPPVVNSVEKNPNVTWTNSSVTISGKVSDTQGSGKTEGSGVSKVVYSTSATGYADNNYNMAIYSNGEYNFIVPREEFNGTYYVWAIDKQNQVSASNEISVKIDTTAPTNISMSYVEDTEKGFFEKAINVLTFGLLFKDEVYIKVNATDNRTDKDSGIKKYQYQLLEVGKDLKDLSDKNWVDFESSEESVEIKLNITEFEDFEGKVYVRVYDIAGNETLARTDTENGTLVVKDNNKSQTSPDVNLNGYTVDTWTKDNITITLSGASSISGVDRYQYRIHYTDGTKPDVDWKDMPESTETMRQADDSMAFVKDKIVISKDENATYYFRAVSNVNLSSDETNGYLVKVQKTIPENAKETIAVANGTNDWYVTHPEITITEPAVSSFAAPVSTYYKIWNTTVNESEGTAAEVKFTGSNPPVISADGEYQLKIWTVDEAGNFCDNSKVILDEIKVDTTKPTELSMVVEGTSIIAKHPNSITYNIFYNKQIKIDLGANCDISGLKSLKYQKVKFASDYSPNGSWTNFDSAKGVVVSPNEKFILYLRAEDNAGNVTIINSDGVIVDNEKPIGETKAPEIDIIPEAANKNGYYNKDVTVSLKVLDPKYSGNSSDNTSGVYSGLKSISYRVLVDDRETLKETVLFPNNAYSYTRDADGLLQNWNGNITINSKDNNSNNVVVEVTAIDNAGNLRTSRTAVGDIKIDITKPTINISYTNNNVDSSKYFKAGRIATIVVTERNFNPKDVKVTVTNTEGVIPEVSQWSKTAGSGNNDDTKWTSTITYATDGDYTFDIQYTDLADNVCVGEVYAGGTAASKEFTIDKTVPTISVAYDNNGANNGKYFASNRTATVTINEHNFETSRIVITATARKDGANIAVPSSNISWNSNGDIRTAAIAYNQDGDYTFDITYKDMAGNESGSANYGSAVAAKDFVIDKTITKPSIKINGSDGNGHAYKAEVIPQINFSDINLASYEVSLNRTRKGEKNVDVTSTFLKGISTDSKSGSGSFNTFNKIQDNDGIYNLKVTMTDKAGNHESESIIFTVNRFGSVYEYSEYLTSLITNGGAYVQAVGNDLVVTEYNADKLLSGSLGIEITCDGKPLTNVKYNASPVPNDTVEVGGSGWYQYVYTISKDNFKANGVYKMVISSKDATGNKPENTNYEDKAILFRVDSTVPEITSIVGLEESIINAQSVTVKYDVYDTIGLKSIMVYVDDKIFGKEITDFGKDLNNYSGSFIINEKSSAQNVRILVEDLAGNVTDTNSEAFSSAYAFKKSVTVSTNIFVRWYANKALFWGSISGVVLLGAGIWYIFRRKKINIVK